MAATATSASSSRKKSATLRSSAHSLLSAEEREILKHVMRVYRHSGSLDTLCTSLAKVVTTQEKVELVNLISEMFPDELSRVFIAKCETRIPIYAMHCKMQQRFNNNFTIPRPIPPPPLLTSSRGGGGGGGGGGGDIGNHYSSLQRPLRAGSSETSDIIIIDTHHHHIPPTQSEKDEIKRNLTAGLPSSLNNGGKNGKNGKVTKGIAPPPPPPPPLPTSIPPSLLYTPAIPPPSSVTVDPFTPATQTQTQTQPTISLEETLTQRINRQVNKDRPKLSVLSDMGFWNEEKLQDHRRSQNPLLYQLNNRPKSTLGDSAWRNRGGRSTERWSMKIPLTITTDNRNLSHPHLAGTTGSTATAGAGAGATTTVGGGGSSGGAGGGNSGIGSSFSGGMILNRRATTTTTTTTATTSTADVGLSASSLIVLGGKGEQENQPMDDEMMNFNNFEDETIPLPKRSISILAISSEKTNNSLLSSTSSNNQNQKQRQQQQQQQPTSNYYFLGKKKKSASASVTAQASEDSTTNSDSIKLSSTTSLLSSSSKPQAWKLHIASVTSEFVSFDKVQMWLAESRPMTLIPQIVEKYKHCPIVARYTMESRSHIANARQLRQKNVSTQTEFDEEEEEQKEGDLLNKEGGGPSRRRRRRTDTDKVDASQQTGAIRTDTSAQTDDA